MNDLNMKQEDDEYLLLYMAENEDDPDNAKLALEEFFERYKNFVTRLCYGILSNIVDGKDGKDLCMEVFYQIFEKAGTFDLDKAVDKKDVKKSIELWISKIAKNMAIDWRRNERKRRKKNEEYQPIYTELNRDKPSNWVPLNDQAAAAFEEVFDSLSPRDREIVIKSGLYFDLEKGSSDMPSHVIDHIADKFGTSPENIRKIRSRFKKRVLKKTE